MEPGTWTSGPNHDGTQPCHIRAANCCPPPPRHSMTVGCVAATRGRHHVRCRLARTQRPTASLIRFAAVASAASRPTAAVGRERGTSCRGLRRSRHSLSIMLCYVTRLSVPALVVGKPGARHVPLSPWSWESAPCAQPWRLGPQLQLCSRCIAAARGKVRSRRATHRHPPAPRLRWRSFARVLHSSRLRGPQSGRGERKRKRCVCGVGGEYAETAAACEACATACVLTTRLRCATCMMWSRQRLHEVRMATEARRGTPVLAIGKAVTPFPDRFGATLWRCRAVCPHGPRSDLSSLRFALL